MRSKKPRTTPILVSLIVLLGLTGLIAPGALGSEHENGFTVRLVNQPKDALENETITSVPLNPNQGFLKVRVTDGGSGVPGVEVTFVLAEGPGLASGSLFVIPQTTDANGIATFGPGTVSIGDANEPQFTDYKLIPVATVPGPSEALALAEATGNPSNGFDIFEEGCRGSGCSVAIREGNDVYTTTQNVRLTASVLSASTLPGMECRNQTLVFPDDVFVHETSGSGVVGLQSHVTAADLGGGGGGGALAVASDDDDDPDDDDEVRIKWCVGTKTRQPWVRNGASFTRQDTNGDGRLDLYVGSAPRCPKKNPRSFAPCIVSRMSDGEGGFIITGWLPGGDPPRRT
jgi:hypothetical protein